MPTIINNPQPNERTVVESDSGGWFVAVIVLILVIAAGLYFWFSYNRAPAQPANPSNSTINVTVPVPSGNSDDSMN